VAAMVSVMYAHPHSEQVQFRACVALCAALGLMVGWRCTPCLGYIFLSFWSKTYLGWMIYGGNFVQA